MCTFESDLENPVYHLNDFCKKINTSSEMLVLKIHDIIVLYSLTFVIIYVLIDIGHVTFLYRFGVYFRS